MIKKLIALFLCLTALAVAAGPYPNLFAKTVTVPVNGSLSGAIDLQSFALVGIVTPAAWDTAVCTFQASADGSPANYTNLYDSFGVEYTVQCAAARTIVTNVADFAGVRFIKVRSGTSGAVVNQTAARALVLLVRPL